MKHTPGPWGLCDDVHPDVSIVAGGDALTVATVTGCDGYDPEANARFIAAAPEMYEALRGALANIEVESGRYAAVRELLARIEGE